MKVINVISAHEHLGVGKLSFSNGTISEYNAFPHDLILEFEHLQDKICCNTLGSILYPQMPYKRYSSLDEYGVSSEHINDSFMGMVQELPPNYSYFPFAYLRCCDTQETNRRLLDKYGTSIFGIKVHPDAELINKRDFLDSGIIELADEKKLPITIHCSRVGGEFDYSSIVEELLPEFSKYNVRVNISHLGFGDKTIFQEKLPENVFVDCSPLGIVLDQFLLLGEDENEFVSGVSDFIKNNYLQVMYGEDFPYNIQKWEDGTIHGRDRMADLDYLFEIILKETPKATEYIFYKNVKRFLG